MTDARSEGLVELLGIREEAVEPGRVRCHLRATDLHRNIQGVVHGVVPMALLDTAMGHALNGLLAPGEFCSTTQISFQFLRALRPGAQVAAEGFVTRRGRRIAYVEGTCRDGEGQLVARAQGTWYVGQVRPSPSPDPA
jgi:uncharacterized protein (TIGR00369 family)